MPHSPFDPLTREAIAVDNVGKRARARQRALNRLRANHRAEFAQLYRDECAKEDYIKLRYQSCIGEYDGVSTSAELSRSDEQS